MVFHDMGNLNFTFIVNDTENSSVDFKKFTLPIIEVLQKLSVNAELSGRNDLTIGGRKFSGNAQYKFKNRLLHHGTLLFTSNISNLTSVLKVDPLKFEGKGIKSVESRVTNIYGIIRQIKLYGDFFGKYDISDIEQAILGTKHEESAVRQVLSSFNPDNYFSNISIDNFMSALFR